MPRGSNLPETRVDPQLSADIGLCSTGLLASATLGIGQLDGIGLWSFHVLDGLPEISMLGPSRNLKAGGGKIQCKESSNPVLYLS